MAQERVVKVTLTAQMQNYLSGMEKARKATADTASEAQKLADTKKHFDQLGRASLAAGCLHPPLLQKQPPGVLLPMRS